MKTCTCLDCPERTGGECTASVITKLKQHPLWPVYAAVADTKIKIQVQAYDMARTFNQTVGEKNVYYVTLGQLESILMQL